MKFNYLKLALLVVTSSFLGNSMYAAPARNQRNGAGMNCNFAPHVQEAMTLLIGCLQGKIGGNLKHALRQAADKVRHDGEWSDFCARVDQILALDASSAISAFRSMSDDTSLPADFKRFMACNKLSFTQQANLAARMLTEW